MQYAPETVAEPHLPFASVVVNSKAPVRVSAVVLLLVFGVTSVTAMTDVGLIPVSVDASPEATGRRSTTRRPRSPSVVGTPARPVCPVGESIRGRNVRWVSMV